MPISPPNLRFSYSYVHKGIIELGWKVAGFLPARGRDRISLDDTFRLAPREDGFNTHLQAH